MTCRTFIPVIIYTRHFIHSTGENPNYEYERQIQSLEQLQFQLLLKVLK